MFVVIYDLTNFVDQFFASAIFDYAFFSRTNVLLHYKSFRECINMGISIVTWQQY